MQVSLSFRTTGGEDHFASTHQVEVGIGTINPTTKLDVRGGSIVVDAFNTSGDHGIWFILRF